MPTDRYKPINLRRTGLVVAIGVGLICVGVTLFMFARGGQGSGAGPTVARIATGEKPPTDPQAGVLPDVGKATIQYVDRNDPTRVAGTIEWMSLDPLPGNRANVAEPRASVFMKDGRSLVVAAPRGRLFTPPKSSQPESGYFEGGVIVALFEPQGDGRVDITTDSPVVLFHTQALSFDLALGELSTGDAFVVSSRSLEVKGKGFRVLFNQVAERIERLDLEEIAYARVAPGVKAAELLRQPPRDAPDPTPAPKPRTPRAREMAKFLPSGKIDVPAGPKSKVTIYQASASRDVKIEQHGRSLASDTLSIWFRLIDNGLPPGALPEGGAVEAQLPAAAGAPGQDGAGQAPGTPALPRTEPPRAVALAGLPAPGMDAPPVLAPVTDEDITISWGGPLQLVPISADPPELDRDHVFARFSAPRSGEVRLADDTIGFEGRAPGMDVGATRQDIALTGTAPGEVRLALKGKGELVCGHVSLNFPSGTAVVRGAGEAKSGEGAKARGVKWTEQADFVFAAVSGRTSDRIESANFAGGVEGRVDQGTLKADVLGADFKPSSRTGEALLSSVRAQNAVAQSAKGQSLNAADLRLTFDESPAGNEAQPQRLDASGAVTAAAGKYRLLCESLQADLARDEAGETVVTQAFADGDVTFGDELMGAGGLTINTDRLIAAPPQERVDLIGAQTSITSGGAMILGSQMNIDGVRRELFVHGPGLFSMRRKAPGRDGAFEAMPTLVSSWSSQMKVNDLSGLAELFGDTRAVATPREDELDQVSAERLIVRFTPGGTGEGRLGDLRVSGAGEADRHGRDKPSQPDRQALGLEAIGASLERGDGPRATIESRRFVRQPGGQRELDRLLYLEGDRILADTVRTTLDVPGPGKLLVQTRERARAPSEDAAPPTRAQQGQIVDLSRGAQGTSLFDWSGSMQLDRAANQMVMRDQVQLLHRQSATDSLVTLRCDTITGFLRDDLGSGLPLTPDDPLGRPAQLRLAVASGNVFVRTEDDKQLSATQLSFDAEREVMEATGDSEADVSFVDPAQPAPTRARALRWFLRDGRIEVSQPSTLIVPR